VLTPQSKPGTGGMRAPVALAELTLSESISHSPLVVGLLRTKLLKSSLKSQKICMWCTFKRNTLKMYISCSNTGEILFTYSGQRSNLFFNVDHDLKNRHLWRFKIVKFSQSSLICAVAFTGKVLIDPSFA
jgi:hypothetical protein